MGEEDSQTVFIFGLLETDLKACACAGVYYSVEMQQPALALGA